MTDAERVLVRNALPTSIEQLGRTAHDLFTRAYGETDHPVKTTVSKVGPHVTQKSVDCLITDILSRLSTEQFADRVLQPMAYNLALEIPGGVSFGCLELPIGCEAARIDYANVSLRIIGGMYSAPIHNEDGIIVAYEPPVPILRMDVLTINEEAGR